MEIVNQIKDAWPAAKGTDHQILLLSMTIDIDFI